MKTPYNFQRVAAERMSSSSGFLLADECGLGKTLTAIEAVKEARTVPFRALVVCPPTLVSQWIASIKDQDPGVDVMASNGIPYMFDRFQGWVVMSGTELSKDYMFAEACKIVWDYVIVDEAHRIKNRKTQLAKAVKRIPKARAFALTATPKEHFEDYWSILNFIRPDLFPTYWAWVQKHLIVEDGYYTKWDIQGPINPVDFSAQLSPHMLQRTKEEVMPELPEKIVIETEVAMHEAQEAAYNEIKRSKDIVVDVDDQQLLIENVMTLLTRLQQISTYPPLLDIQRTSGKFEWLAQFVKDHPNEPIAVFSRFRRPMELLAATYGGGLVIGGVDDSKDFARGLYNSIFCVIADNLQGVDGLQRAKHAIFLDAHWSATQMTQAIDRVHRMDIKEPKNVYMLHSTYEDRLVLKAINEKWTENELVRYFLSGGP